MESDQVYLLGLCQDVEIPLLLEMVSNYFEILKNGNKSTADTLSAIEDNEPSTNHTLIGYRVSEDCGLSPEIRETILHHHNEATFVHQDNLSFARRVGLLTISEYFCRLYRSENEDSIWLRVGDAIHEMFGLTDDDIADLIEETQDILSAR